MLSQQQSTTSSNKVEINTSQVTELYKIVKQNDYLKVRVTSAEKGLNEAEKTIKSQEVLLKKKDNALKMSEDILAGEKKEHQKELEVKNIQIERLNFEISEGARTLKKQNRKKFWTGFAYGGVTIAVIGTGTIFYLLSK